MWGRFVWDGGGAVLRTNAGVFDRRRHGSAGVVRGKCEEKRKCLLQAGGGPPHRLPHIFSFPNHFDVFTLLSSPFSLPIYFLLPSPSPKVFPLDFVSLQHEDLRPLPFPLPSLTAILAADVIYDDDITLSFVEALVTCLHRAHSLCTAYVAVDLRVNFRVQDLTVAAHTRECFALLLSEYPLSWESEVWERGKWRGPFTRQMGELREKEEEGEEGEGVSERYTRGEGRSYELFKIRKKEVVGRKRKRREKKEGEREGGGEGEVGKRSLGVGYVKSNRSEAEKGH